MTPTLLSIHTYPIKSCMPLDHDAAEVEPRGLRDDRRWLLVDANGKFITGRQLGALVRLRALPHAHGLRLSFDDGDARDVALPRPDGPRREVTVWRDTVQALVADAAIGAWLGARFGQALELVYMDAAAHRKVDPKYARAGEEVSFADGFPLLLIGQGSLDGLNARMAQPITMRRFRPNLVVTGVEAHAEDSWRVIRVGEVVFDVVKPCTRCVFTTVDPDTGLLDARNEPLNTLKTYRRGESGITFGQNLLPRNNARVRVGDSVEVLEYLL